MMLDSPILRVHGRGCDRRLSVFRPEIDIKRSSRGGLRCAHLTLHSNLYRQVRSSMSTRPRGSTRMTNSREQGHDATGSPWQPGRPVVPGVTRRHFLQATGLGAAAAAAVGIGAGTAAAATAGRPTAAKPLAAGLTGTISDLKHVVILMQENRSFDHYFGTLSGVRGFGDKQALTWQNGNSVFQQPDSARTDLGYLLPYNLTDQTDGDLDHSWSGDHEAWNSGLWNQWVAAKSRRRWATSPGPRSRSSTRWPTRSPSATATTRRSWGRPAPTGCTSGPARRRAGPPTRATTRSTSAPTPRRPRSPRTRSCCRRPG